MPKLKTAALGRCKRCPASANKQEAETSASQLFISVSSTGAGCKLAALLLLPAISLLLAECPRAGQQAFAASLHSTAANVPFKTSFVSSSDNPAIQRRNGALIALSMAQLAEQANGESAGALLAGSSLAEPAQAARGASDGADSAGGQPLVAAHLASVHAELHTGAQLTSAGAQPEDLLAIPSTQMLAPNSTATISVDASPTTTTASPGAQQVASTTQPSRQSAATTTTTAITSTQATTPNKIAGEQVKSSEAIGEPVQNSTTLNGSSSVSVATSATTTAPAPSGSVLTLNVTDRPPVEPSSSTAAAAPTTTTTTAAAAAATSTARTTTAASTTPGAEPMREPRMAAQQQPAASNSAKSTATFVIGAVPLLNGSKNSSSTGDATSEFVFMPAENLAPLGLDETAFMSTKLSNASSDSLPAEHRALDGADLELDYMNMEVGPGGDEPAAGDQGASSTQRPASGQPMSSSLASHVDVSERLRASAPSSSATAPSTTSTTTSSTTSTTTAASTTSTTSTTTAAPPRTSAPTTTSSTTRRPTTSQPAPATSARKSNKLLLEPSVVPKSGAPSSSGPKAPSSSATTTAPTTSPAGRQAAKPSRRAKSAQGHRTYYSEPAAGDWRRKRVGPTASRDNFSPTLNGADEEEAHILTRYSIPSQLNRLSTAGGTETPASGGGARRSSSASRREHAAALSSSTTRKPARLETTTLAAGRRASSARLNDSFVGRDERISSLRSSAVRVTLDDESPSVDLSSQLSAGEQDELIMTLIASSISAQAEQQGTRETKPAPDRLSGAQTSATGAAGVAGATSATSTTSTTSTTAAPTALPTAITKTTTTTTSTSTTTTSTQPPTIVQQLERGVERRRAAASAPKTGAINSYGLQQQQQRGLKSRHASGARNADESYNAPAQFDSGQWRPDTHVDYSLAHTGDEPANERRASEATLGNAPAASLPGRAGIDYPVHWQVPKTSFDCRHHEQSGFYADVESDCQAYHSCHRGRGGRHTFLCPNGTLFSQELLTCDWWYNVECSASKLYMPGEIGQQQQDQHLDGQR